MDTRTRSTGLFAYRIFSPRLIWDLFYRFAISAVFWAYLRFFASSGLIPSNVSLQVYLLHSASSLFRNSFVFTDSGQLSVFRLIKFCRAYQILILETSLRTGSLSPFKPSFIFSKVSFSAPLVLFRSATWLLLHNTLGGMVQS